jgi:hypothetical protein
MEKAFHRSTAFLDFLIMLCGRLVVRTPGILVLHQSEEEALQLVKAGGEELARLGQGQATNRLVANG